ncbi:MAG: alpha/beta hydrolase [Candidatus Dormiibacterota bacterium]
MDSSEFDLELSSGRLHAKRHGSPDAPLVIAIPGLSANLMSFQFIGERLAEAGMQLVALDLRGRGRSDVTAVGTYGWVNHATDVLAVADALGAARCSLIGHSMGAAVAMAAAQQGAGRLDRIVLIDLCGVPDPSTRGPIAASTSRLGMVFPTLDDYLERVRSTGVITPWSTYWEQYFAYELQPAEGGVTARTSAAAVMEDAMFGAGAFAFGDDAGIYGLWHSLTMPVLALRATREMVPGTGFILSARDAERFPGKVRSAVVREIDANHFTIATTDETVTAIKQFFSAGY